jgi:predicted phage tail protein
MTRSIIPFIVAGMSACWLAPQVLAAEQTNAADTAQTDETWNNIKAYSLEKKNEAVAYGRKLLKETDARIEQLEAKAARLSGEAKVQYAKEVQDLKAKRADTAAKLDKMAKESGKAWDKTKQGFADAYKDLQSAYYKAVKRFN